MGCWVSLIILSTVSCIQTRGQMVNLRHEADFFEAILVLEILTHNLSSWNIRRTC